MCFQFIIYICIDFYVNFTNDLYCNLNNLRKQSSLSIMAELFSW